MLMISGQNNCLPVGIFGVIGNDEYFNIIKVNTDLDFFQFFFVNI